MHKRTWKRREAGIARFFGAKRSQMSGASGPTRSDTNHPTLYIEAKSRGPSSTGWWHGLLRFFKDEQKKAKKEEKTLVLTHAYKDLPGFLITVHSSDMWTVVQEYLRARGYDLPESEE